VHSPHLEPKAGVDYLRAAFTSLASPFLSMERKKPAAVLQRSADPTQRVTGKRLSRTLARVRFGVLASRPSP